jgi:hypothetical protein
MIGAVIGQGAHRAAGRSGPTKLFIHQSTAMGRTSAKSRQTAMLLQPR